MIILFSIFTVFNCLKSYEFFYTMYKNINFNKYQNYFQQNIEQIDKCFFFSASLIKQIVEIYFREVIFNLIDIFTQSYLLVTYCLARIYFLPRDTLNSLLFPASQTRETYVLETCHLCLERVYLARGIFRNIPRKSRIVNKRESRKFHVPGGGLFETAM